MFKRVVALLLLPTVLLTQWVSAGQCHGCRHVAGNDSNPHIHLMGWPFIGCGPQSRPEQHQGCHGCCHHDDDQDGDKDSGDPIQHQHDTTDHQGEGIVYLPTSLVHGWLTGRSPTSLDDVGKTPFLALLDNLLIQVQPIVCTQSPPAFLTVADSPASLRTLPLLI